MKINSQDHLHLSLLGFTTFTLKLISVGNMTLLKKTLSFITRLFIQSSVEVKGIIIEHYLYTVYNFLNDCSNKEEIIGNFPFWMRSEYLNMMKKSKDEPEELVIVLHLN